MLIDVRPVYVVQDRATGAFVDINMTFVSSLRAAARADSVDQARETMHYALYDDLLACPDGYDVVMLLEPADERDWENLERSF